MDQQLQDRINTLEQKIDAIYTTTEKTRKYFQWTLIITVVALVLPLIGLLIAIPALLNTYSQVQNF